MPLCLPPGAAAALPLLRLPPGGGAYRETALLAAAADTLTLPLRLSGALRLGPPAAGRRRPQRLFPLGRGAGRAALDGSCCGAK